MQGQCETCLAKIQCPNCGHDAKQKAVLLRSLRAEVKQLTDELTCIKQRHKEMLDKLVCFVPPSVLDSLKESV
jgi:hypothetical protein